MTVVDAGGGRMSQPPRAGCLFPDASLPDDLSATAAPWPASSPGSPTASSTTGHAPVWSCRAIRTAHGSGTQRLYSFKDILVLKVVKRLLDTGVSLQNIRVAVDAPAVTRGRRPGRYHPVQRRHDGLRVHAPRKRSSTCCRAARACSASRSAAPCGRSGHHPEFRRSPGPRPTGRRRPSSRPAAARTSWPPAGPAAAPAERRANPTDPRRPVWRRSHLDGPVARSHRVRW